MAKTFNAEEETKKIIEFTKNHFKKNNFGGAIIGISGGKDSGVVAAILANSIGGENILGLTLPCESKKEDQELAINIANTYHFKLLNVDLTGTFKMLRDEIISNFDAGEDKYLNSDINLKPRLRMSTLYYHAALMTAISGKTYIVVGTSNKSELFVGYFTKGGDNVNDFNPIADLTVEEVIKVGEVLKVPHETLYKTPSDGLSGKSDEQKMGVSYKDIALYMENESQVDDDVAKTIKRMHDNNAHKFHIPIYKKGE